MLISMKLLTDLGLLHLWFVWVYFGLSLLWPIYIPLGVETVGENKWVSVNSIKIVKIRGFAAHIPWFLLQQKWNILQLKKKCVSRMGPGRKVYLFHLYMSTVSHSNSQVLANHATSLYYSFYLVFYTIIFTEIFNTKAQH